MLISRSRQRSTHVPSADGSRTPRSTPDRDRKVPVKSSPPASITDFAAMPAGVPCATVTRAPSCRGEVVPRHICAPEPGVAADHRPPTLESAARDGAAAHAAHEAAGAARFGVLVGGPVRIDGRAVMQRVRRERDRFVGFVVDAVDAWPSDTRVCRRVRFLDDHTLELDGGDRI